MNTSCLEMYLAHVYKLHVTETLCSSVDVLMYRGDSGLFLILAWGGDIMPQPNPTNPINHFPQLEREHPSSQHCGVCRGELGLSWAVGMCWATGMTLD